MLRPLHSALVFLLAVLAAPGLALEPNEVFALAGPSVVSVLASDAKDEKGIVGSGVIIAPLQILTSCQVVASAMDVVVTQGSALRKARLRFQDDERDLCQIQIETALPAGTPVAATVASRDLKVGQTVYAITSPRGMELSISRGMVSSLRETTGDNPVVQTDLSIYGGSIGGGLFDHEARLVGILTTKFRQGDEAVYAAPSDWFATLPQRSQDRLAAAAVSSGAGVEAVRAPATNERPVWMPRTGDLWKYRVFDGKRSVGTIVIEVVGVRGTQVEERITREGFPSFQFERDVGAGLNAAALLDPVSLPGGYQLIELAPYIAPTEQLTPGRNLGPMSGRVDVTSMGTRSLEWRTRIVGRERIRVPAGEFDAAKIESVAQTSTRHGEITIKSTYWVSEQALRTVKINLNIKWAQYAASSDESYELAASVRGN